MDQVSHTSHTAMAQQMSCSARFKLKVVERAEESGNRQAGREYGVSEKLLRDWRKEKGE